MNILIKLFSIVDETAEIFAKVGYGRRRSSGITIAFWYIMTLLRILFNFQFCEIENWNKPLQVWVTE